MDFPEFTEDQEEMDFQIIETRGNYLCDDKDEDDDLEIEIVEVRAPTSKFRRLLTGSVSHNLESLRVPRRKLKLSQFEVSRKESELEDLKEDVNKHVAQISQITDTVSAQQKEIEMLREENARLKNEAVQERLERVKAEKRATKLTTFVSALNNEFTEMIKAIKPKNDKTEESKVESELNHVAGRVNDKLGKLATSMAESKRELAKTTEAVDKLAYHLFVKITSKPEDPKANSRAIIKAPGITKIRPREQDKWTSTSIDKQMERTIRLNKNGNMTQQTKQHFRDITKRDKGFYCICGIECSCRKRLNAHIQRFGSVYAEESDDEEEECRVKKRIMYT